MYLSLHVKRFGTDVFKTTTIGGGSRVFIRDEGKSSRNEIDSVVAVFFDFITGKSSTFKTDR